MSVQNVRGGSLRGLAGRIMEFNDWRTYERIVKSVNRTTR